MSEEVTLEDFTGDNEGILSAEPQGVRLALDESYPEEWGFAELEEVCEVNSGFTWNKEQETDSSEESAVPVIKIGNVQDGYLDLDDILYLTGVSDKDLRDNKARKDWLLMIGSNGSGERVGHCGIIEEDMEFVYASFLYGLHPDSGHLLPRFLFYSLNRPKVQQRLTSFTAGSTSLKNLNKSTIENLSIPTPSLSEQRKIATVLYTVDRAIEKTEKIINQFRITKKGVIQNLLTKGAYDHTSYEKYRLGPIDLTKPEEWELRSFDEFSFRVQDGPHITPDYVEEGIPFVSSQNVNPFGEKFDYSEYEKYISENTYEEINQNCRPELGDLIISRRATIGPTQLIRRDDQFAFFVGVAIIKTDDSVDNAFLEQLMNWSVMNKLWHLKSPGSTMKTLNLGTIKEQKIPLPSIQEQQEIANILGSIDEGINNNQRYKETLQRLKRGLMQDLLSGTVRTTDTNIQVPDEVAQYG